MTTNVKHVIDTMIKSRDKRQDEVAKMAGWKGQSGLSTAINRDNPSFETLFRICEALGYDIVIRDRKTTNRMLIERVDGDE